jgi:lipoprotein-releasing system ATP-binding protein
MNAAGLGIACSAVVRGYPGQEVLRGVDLAVSSGETVAIQGASGTGKSTLLHCLGLLDRPDSGTIHLADQRVDHLRGAARSRVRSRRIGFVFQAFHLLPDFSVIENIVMAARVAGLPLGTAQVEAQRLLERVGIADKANKRVTTLSGGERSRVALCRALLNRPAALLADEPTGNLDPATASVVLQTLLDLARDHRASVIIVTHDAAVAGRCDRQLVLRDGLLSPA